MSVIELVGRINEHGVVEVEGTTDLRPGTKVKVIVLETSDQPKAEGWGTQVLSLLDSLDLSEWETMDIPDVTEWVKKQRRGNNWGNS